MTDQMTGVRSQISQMLAEVVEGWCSEPKAFAMADLIERTRPKLCVEIGVFGGRSLFAQAIAMRTFSPAGSIIVGIDPWQKAAAKEGDVGDANRAWWDNVDMHRIHSAFMDHLWRLGLSLRCIVIRNGSEECAKLFQPGSIDILHIDGNHSEEVSCRDVATWLPLVKPGGHIWFDDINWETTQRALGVLRDHCKEISKVEFVQLFQLRSQVEPIMWDVTRDSIAVSR